MMRVFNKVADKIEVSLESGVYRLRFELADVKAVRRGSLAGQQGVGRLADRTFLRNDRDRLFYGSNVATSCEDRVLAVKQRDWPRLRVNREEVAQIGGRGCLSQPRAEAEDFLHGAHHGRVSVGHRVGVSGPGQRGNDNQAAR